MVCSYVMFLALDPLNSLNTEYVSFYGPVLQHVEKFKSGQGWWTIAVQGSRLANGQLCNKCFCKLSFAVFI